MFFDTLLGKEGTGISLPGASLWYRMADTEGNEISSVYTQQSCTSHKSLLLPYSLFGLGRSPNFVEQLRVGIPSSPPANQTWQQIVPNSRMYVIPVPSDAPGHWIGRLYITPSRLILSSVAALGGVCMLLLIAIVILHYYESKADRKERELQRKQFHFDAMWSKIFSFFFYLLFGYFFFDSASFIKLILFVCKTCKNFIRKSEELISYVFLAFNFVIILIILGLSLYFFDRRFIFV